MKTAKTQKQVRKFFASQKQNSKRQPGKFWANTSDIGVSTSKTAKVSGNVSVAMLSLYCSDLR